MKNARIKHKRTPMGEAIAKRMIDMDMNRNDLAEKLNVQNSYISMIIYGIRAGIKYIDKLEEVLEIDLSEFKKSA